MREKWIAVAGVLAVAAASRPAAAQYEPGEEAGEAPLPPNTCPPGTYPVYPPAQQPYSAYPAPPVQVYREPAYSPTQFALSVGGGVGGFARDPLRNGSSVAGVWDVRATYGTRSWLAVEAGYLGSAANSYGFRGTQMLSTAQLSGDLRINLSKWRFQPFIDAGAGWVNLHRWNSVPQAPVGIWNENENSLVVPVGGGVAGYIGEHGVVDARFDYRFIPDKAIIVAGPRPDMWIVLMRIGYAF